MPSPAHRSSHSPEPRFRIPARALGLLACLGALPWPGAWAETQVLPIDDLTDLSLEQLLDVEVVSVAKKRRKVSDTAAAVFVITAEDLRRSGVTSIPEALRMVPGLQVARIDANKWAVSARGFNGRFANKLLVLMDGRSVYAPSFSGVYWEVQDTLMEDIERIEVIRGPGATLWGANAVNGVINIITRPAGDTRGGLVTAGLGDAVRGYAGLRYGGAVGESGHLRAYVKGLSHDAFARPGGGDAGDDWTARRGGFRYDGAPTERDSLTVQGDAYRGDLSQELSFFAPGSPVPLSVDDNAEVSGWNLLGRWRRNLGEGSELSLQVYYDHNNRDEAFVRQVIDTLDIDLQHRVEIGERHDLIWGLGYRFIQDNFANTATATFDPDDRDVQLFSGFVQDDITLVPGRWRLTLGTKFEHNDHTGFEIQPNARLLWTPAPTHTVWASVSRAVRTPSRIEDDFSLVNLVAPPFTPGLNPSPLPLSFVVEGDRDFDSEELIAYELGYRVQASQTLSLDIAAYYNRYDGLRTNRAGPTTFTFAGLVPIAVNQPLIFDNGMGGATWGVEVAGDWRPRPWWRWQAAYSYLKMDLHGDAGTEDRIEGSSPHHQLSLRSGLTLGASWNLDLWLRYVDDLPSLISARLLDVSVDSYTTLDARLAWRPRRGLELALVGRNLLDRRHPEFVEESFTTATEVERSVLATARLSF